MTEQIELAIDVATHTTRGRICPRCGGKIIPSIRSAYGDPSGVFAAWQCERCSYEEVFSRPTATAAGGTTSKAVAKDSAQLPKSAPGASPAPALQATPSMQDAQGRELPADVRVMLSQMSKAQAKLPTN